MTVVFLSTPARDALDDKANRIFAGKVVRKDLVRKVKVGANVPVFVLEYLLGQYAASDNEATIQAGIDAVRQILADHYVHRNQSELVKSTIRASGKRVRITPFMTPTNGPWCPKSVVMVMTPEGFAGPLIE